MCIAQGAFVGVWFQRQDYVFPKAKDACALVSLPVNVDGEDRYMVEQSGRMVSSLNFIISFLQHSLLFSGSDPTSLLFSERCPAEFKVSRIRKDINWDLTCPYSI